MMDQQRRAGERGAELVERLHAGRVSGRAVPADRRPDRVSQPAGRRHARAAAGPARPARRSGTSSTWPRIPAKRRWRRGSRRTNWRIACSRTPPKRSTWPTRPEPIARAVRARQQGRPAHFGRNCLLARRLVERGVRFVQIYSGGNEGPKAWDAHDDIKKNHDLHCAETDLPIAGLLDRPEAPRPARLDAGRSGAASSAARRSPRTARAATITPRPSPCGWPAAASRAA